MTDPAPIKRRRGRPAGPVKREIPAAIPTWRAILKSLVCSHSPATCNRCIHYRKGTDDVYDYAPTCWCATREHTITWVPCTKRCAYFYDGTQVQERIAEELRWCKMSVKEWLKNRDKK